MNAQHEMKDWRDDPRLTAYAFGELDGDDRAAIETLIAENDEARALVDELRAFGGELEAELAASADGGLTDEQRATIDARLTGRSVRPRAAGRILGFRPSTWRLAAGLTVVGVAGVFAWELLRDGATGSAPGEAEPYTYSIFGDDARVAQLDESERAPATPRESADHRVQGLGYVDGKDANARGSRPSVAASSQPAPPAADAPASEPDLEALQSLGYVGDSETGAIRDRLKGEARRLNRVQVQQLEALGYADGDDRYDDAPEGDVHRRPTGEFRTEGYDHLVDNPLTLVADDPRSTFSIDVDTASYSNVRRFLTSGQLPPADAVRIEELVNYFDYEYLHPQGDDPFAVDAAVADCPWAPGRQLVRIGLQGRTFTSPVPKQKNLVFLLDVSGSMNSDDKLPLLKRGFRMLAQSLRDGDRVAIAVYAGASGLVLPSTPGSERSTILAAIDRLSAGGSTNGGAGIELAYRVASEHFVPGGINRVILATDGDFNVGTTSRGELIRLIEEKRETGVFLSVLGFGQGNLKDSQMEQIADHGNGAYHYIDSEREAKKVLVRELDATLETIAKDVKIQVEFNPAYVQAYRLIGYANRILAHQDFNDDTKDAGEIGAGHTVTAFYEVVPVGASLDDVAGVDPLKYQPERSADAAPTGTPNGELMNVKLRYKRPDGDTSTKLEVPVETSDRAFADTNDDFRFAAAVALFGMVLRDSEFKGDATLQTVRAIAESGASPDPWGDRAEFLELVQRAAQLRGVR